MSSSKPARQEFLWATPSLRVMTNDSDEAIYMAIKVDYTDNLGDPMSATDFKKYAEITDYNEDDWEKVAQNSDGSEIWIYKTAVKAGESTDALFNNVKVNAQITEEWSTLAKTTTIYKCDADGNKIEVIDVKTDEYDPTIIYKDQDGNIVDAGTLPTFNIKVTGFAVQASTFNTSFVAVSSYDDIYIIVVSLFIELILVIGDGVAVNVRPEGFHGGILHDVHERNFSELLNVLYFKFLLKCQSACLCCFSCEHGCVAVSCFTHRPEGATTFADGSSEESLGKGRGA